VSLIAPARWGLAAIASTIDLNGIQKNAVPTQDLLWTHNAAHWLTAMAAMLLIGLIWLVIARVRLATIGPKKRKEGKRSTVPNPQGQPVRV
jgi:ABC transport system ATP-binding/permease protein